MQRLLLLLLLIAASAPRAQQPLLPPAVRAAADRITSDQLKRDLDFLASEALLGRNTPSPGFDQAADYIARRLAKAGVTPLGDNGTFFQRYEMHESRIDTEAAFLEIDGRRFPFGEGFVIRSFAAAVSGPLPVVYVGHGWTVPGKGIDPYAGVDVKGKLVLAHGPRAMPRDVEIQQIGRITPGASSVVAEAARRGAAGVILVPQTSGLTNWEQMRGQNLVRKELEPPVPSAYAAAPATAVLLSRAASEALLAGERIGGADLIARGDASDYPASFQLTRAVSLNVPARTTVHRPFNVVALIEGSDPVLRREYITIASHLDGAVGTRAVAGDSVYNSADDNATGSAANLSIAEMMMTAPRPKRSVIFIWDSGEEQGLWGTRHFVGHPPVPFDRIVAHINIDMIGANRAPGSPDAQAERVSGPNEVFLIGPGALSTQADALLARVNREYLNIGFNRLWDRPESEFFYPRTDAGPFLERGVLTIGFTTGIHDRYHLPSDEARALDPKKMEVIARTIFAGAWALADASERPRIDKPIPGTVPRLMGAAVMAQGPTTQTPTTQAPTPPGPVAGRGGGRGGPALVSPQIEADGRVTFRVLAPQATTVMVTGDINGSLVPLAPSATTAAAPVAPAPAAAAPGPPGGGRGGPPAVVMAKGENGVWAGTTARAVKPGAWRYNFNVDGATTVDSRNVRVSPNQTQVQSVLYVPGDFSETRDVPHGAVSIVRYVATALGGARREMYVYTPPGYAKGTASYPVLYLIHGGGDTAGSWSTVGRANDILDNLIAEKKARPMIVVMPSGWTPSGGQVMTSDATKDPFNDEMIKDIIPFVQANYRTLATPENRALSGLSMGGIQTLNVGLHNLGTFRYLAVMSSGWTTEADREFFYKTAGPKFPTYNKALKMFWWGWGETDIARANGLAVIDRLKSHGVTLETMETPGGHEWSNWRLYLHEIAPKLFR